MRTIERSVDVKANQPKSIKLSVKEANQGFQGVINFGNAQGFVETGKDLNGDGELTGREVAQRVAIPVGSNDRPVLFRTRKGDTLIEFNSNRNTKIKVRGKIDTFFKDEVVVDPITSPGSGGGVVIPPTPGPTTPVTTPVTTTDTILRMIAEGSITLNVNVVHSGAVDVNHTLNGTIGVDGNILFEGIGCGGVCPPAVPPVAPAPPICPPPAPTTPIEPLPTSPTPVGCI